MTSEAKTFGLSPRQRLRRPAEFRHVMQRGKRVRHPLLHMAFTASSDGPRIGLTVPKRVLRRAHDRNRVKRVIRESFRMRQHRLPACDVVVFARHGVGEQSNADLQVVLDKLWERLARSQV